MTKIGAEIVTFNPDVEQLKANVDNVLKQVEKLVLVDNGSKNVEEVKRISTEFNIELILLNENKGIAAALNKGMEFLKASGMTWVVTLDQDSLLPDDAVLNFKNTKQFEEDDTAILAAQYDDKNWSDIEREKTLAPVNQDPIEKDIVITSGNMVKLDAWSNVGGFDEWLFIDQVDFDFNARLRLAGYKIWQVNAVVMPHEIGAAMKNGLLARMLLIKKSIHLMQHSPFREYYMQRNSLVYAKRYPAFRTKKGPLWFISLANLRHVLLSDTPWSGLFAGLKGTVDGLRYTPNKDTFMQKFWENLSE